MKFISSKLSDEGAGTLGKTISSNGKQLQKQTIVHKQYVAKTIANITG